MNLYDIVRLVSPDNEDLDGKTAFITRIPMSASDNYDIFYPGDELTPPKFLIYSDTHPERGDIPSVITDPELVNPYKTLAETLNLEHGSLLAGSLKSNPTITHPLRVIRIEDNALIVSRTDDPTETPIEIPLENGIAIGSDYGFLRPAYISDDSEPEIHPDKHAFLERLKTVPDITVVYTKTPVIPEKIEIPVVGGTQDISRLTGQIVSAIKAIDSKEMTDSTRIQALIKDTTLNAGDTRVILSQDDPIMVRSKLPVPPWIIPVDDSRSGIVTTDSTTARIPDERKVDSKKPYHLYNKLTSSGLQLPPPNGTVEGLSTVQDRTEVIFTKEPPVEINKGFSGKYTSDFSRKRVLLPTVSNICSRNPYASSIRDADKYHPMSAIMFPPNGYYPNSAPVLLRLTESPWLSPDIIDTDEIIESSIPPSSEFITTPTLLPQAIVGDRESMLSYVSPTLESVLSLPLSLGSIDEIGRVGGAYGYYTHGILTHDERLLASTYLKHSSQHVIRKFLSKDLTVPIYSVSPKGLYKDLKDLQTLYPETLGLIRKEEAFDRIIRSLGDHGRVLYSMIGADEYTAMEGTVRDIIRNAEGKRIKVREEMAIIQARLRELETTLRTLPMIAKHYGSRKDVEKAKGTTPLWDEHLDDDPDKHLYYSDRFRKIIGKLLSELQAKGELDLQSEMEEGSDVCDPDDLIKKIPTDQLHQAVREDLEKYNLSVGEGARLTGERFDVIVQRIIAGGRLVRNGDVALITRHLRTAAYRWDDKNRRWNPIRDDEDIFAGNDIKPKANPTRIFTQTLHLNKEYRQLSKMKDDLEMMLRRPELMTDPERLTESLNTLIESVGRNADKRIAYLRKNRVIDEIPFLYDRVKYGILRHSFENEQVPEDGEDDGRITAADLRRAKMRATLVTDVDLDVFESGYGNLSEVPKERFGSAGSILDTDPILMLTERRNGPSAFIAEVSGRERVIRVYLSAIGFMETLLQTPLSQEEVIICAKEADTILPLKANNKDAIQRGIATYCMMICTRYNSHVLLPKAEGETPPPSSEILPSYRVPVRDSDDDGILPFIVKVLTKSSRLIVEGKSSTTFYVILTSISKVGITRTKEDTDGKNAVKILRDKISRISKISPGITARVLKIGTVKTRLEDTETGLKLSNKWESLPIIHNPHPSSSIIEASRSLLKDVDLALRDPKGIPYPNNAVLPLPVSSPAIINALEPIHNIKSEKVQELFYNARDDLEHTLHSLVVVSPAPTFIGVLRERIPTKPLVEAEVPNVTPITLPPPASVSRSDPPADMRRKLEGLITDILREGEIGHLSRTDTRPIKNISSELRTVDDFNGALRAGVIAYHDTLILAIQQYLRMILSEAEPVSCEQTLYPDEYKFYQKGSRDIPIYTAHAIIKGLLKGVQPMSIEYSSETYPEKGGSRNTVLTGENTYFSKVKDVVAILDELRVRNPDIIKSLSNITASIRDRVALKQERITRDELFEAMYNVLNEEKDLNAAELYITLLGHSSDIYKKSNNLALLHTDLNDIILDEELNYDREKERQRFIYQLEALDPERRELARASRALGVDLAGRVAKDPRKFNSEYYEIINNLVATQEMQDRASDSRIAAYGDRDDVELERRAIDGAFEGVEQIEGIDFD